MAAQDAATMKRLKQAFPSAAETLPTGAKPLFSYEDEDPIEAFFGSAHPHRGSYPRPPSQPSSDGAPMPAPDITFKRVAVKQTQPCSHGATDSDDHTTMPTPKMDLRNAPGWGAYVANASVANAANAQKGEARGTRQQQPHESFSSGAAASESALIQIVDFMPEAGRSAANLRASLSPRTASPPSCTSPQTAPAAAISQAPNKDAAPAANLGEGSIFKRLTPAQMLRACISSPPPPLPPSFPTPPGDDRGGGGGGEDIMPPKPPATIKRSNCVIPGIVCVCARHGVCVCHGVCACVCLCVCVCVCVCVTVCVCVCVCHILFV